MLWRKYLFSMFSSLQSPIHASPVRAKHVICFINNSDSDTQDDPTFITSSASLSSFKNTPLTLKMVVKLCFVTVGATASFEKLVQAVLHESFLAELEKHKFTRLLIQYGKGGQHIFDAYRAEYESGNIDHGVEIGGFELRPNMTPYLRMVQDDPTNFQELGMVISHAGE